MDASERKTPVTWDPPRDEDWFWAFAKAIGTDSGLDVPLCPDGVAGSLALFKRAAQAEALREAADADPPKDAMEFADPIDLFTWACYCEWLRARAEEVENG